MLFTGFYSEQPSNNVKKAKMKDGKGKYGPCTYVCINLVYTLLA